MAIFDGTPGNDTLRGTDDAETMNGRQGSDSPSAAMTPTLRPSSRSRSSEPASDSPRKTSSSEPEKCVAGAVGHARADTGGVRPQPS